MGMFPAHQVWPKTILQGTVKKGRRQGRRRKRWEDNIREWTGMEFAKSQKAVENWEKWRKLVVKSSVAPQWPSQLRDTQPTLYIGPTRAPCGFVGFCVGPCMRAWYLTGTFRASPVRCGWRDNTSKPAFRPPSADRSPSACGYLSREAEYRMVLK